MRPTTPQADRPILQTDPLRSNALQVVALASFAIAQPLYDILGRNPTFFVYRRWQGTDFLAFVLLLSVVLPLLLVAVAELLGILGRPVRKTCYGLLASLLAALFVLPLMARIESLTAWPALLLALLAGGVFALAGARLPGLRRFLTLLAVPAILFFGGAFLLRDGIRQQWLGSSRVQTSASAAHTGPPIAMLVFDALPTSSLMDAEQGIDPVRYPAFARLARESTWYRRATTVAAFTKEAVASILTGRCPQEDKPPLFASHPRSLFTFLGNGYHFEVAESVTRLCPEDLCGSAGRPTFQQRFLPLLSDSVVVFLHGALPSEWTLRLPPVDRAWGDFGKRIDGGEGHQRGGKGMRVDEFRRRLSGLRNTTRPTLFFSHLVLPHEPFYLLPSGRTYREREVMTDDAWKAFGDDPWVSRHSYQRHLLQVGYADSLLGELLDRLKELGLYEETLIIVTADHGVSFRPGAPRRSMTEANAHEILPVPLLVKRPHQEAAIVTDEAVQTVDILPLIAEVLERPPPEWSDGRVPEGAGDAAYSCPRIGNARTPVPAMGLLLQAADRKIELFGTGAEAGSFPRVGPHPELIGVEASGIECADSAPLEVDIRDPELFTDVDPDSGFVPVEIVGTARHTSTHEELDLAVAVNGIVQATTRAYRHGIGDTNLWSAIVPEAAFRKGGNDVAVFAIETAPGGCRLLPSTGLSSPLSFLGTRFGAWSVPYVSDRGFRTTQKFDGRVARWTGERAMVTIPLSASEANQVRRLRVALAASGEKGTRLRIRLNEVTLFDERIEPGRWSRTFDVDPPDPGQPVVVRMECDTFSRRGARLGVAVEGIWLLPESAEVSRMPAGTREPSTS